MRSSVSIPPPYGGASPIRAVGGGSLTPGGRGAMSNDAPHPAQRPAQPTGDAPRPRPTPRPPGPGPQPAPRPVPLPAELGTLAHRPLSEHVAVLGAVRRA